MILYYFYKTQPITIACAETDETAARLVMQGYKRCAWASYMRLWAAQDGARRAQLAKEDAARGRATQSGGF